MHTHICTVLNHNFQNATLHVLIFLILSNENELCHSWLLFSSICHLHFLFIEVEVWLLGQCLWVIFTKYLSCINIKYQALLDLFLHFFCHDKMVLLTNTIVLLWNCTHEKKTTGLIFTFITVPFLWGTLETKSKSLGLLKSLPDPEQTDR